MISCAWILYLSLAGTFGGPGSHHEPDHHEHHCDHQCMIDEMLVNVGMAFDKEHCHAFEHVHCPTYIIANEEVCSNEGTSYANHCQFVQDSCDLILDHENYNHETIIHAISVKNLGPCVTSTVQPPVTTTQTPVTATPQPVTATQQTVNATQQPVNATQQVVTTTQQPAAQTSQAMFTQQPTTQAPVATTTAISMAQILGQVFCSHRNEFICGQVFDVVCASDGKYYPNTCELSKVQCDDYTLVKKDILFCSTQALG